MTWVRTAFAEIWGLFVDDGLLAVLTTAWLVVIGLAARYANLDGSMLAMALFGGLASILVASIARAARRSK